MSFIYEYKGLKYDSCWICGDPIIEPPIVKEIHDKQKVFVCSIACSKESDLYEKRHAWFLEQYGKGGIYNVSED